MHTTRWLAAVLSGIMAVLAPGVPASAADFRGPYHFQSAYYTNTCADVAYGATNPGARVQQWTCYDGAAERWRMDPVPYLVGPTRFYQVWNLNSRLCLDLPYGDPAKPLQQWRCQPGDQQLWAAELYPDGKGIRLRNLMANYQCLSVDTAHGAGASLWVRPCQPVNSQRWLTTS
ncbi:hypothetical protein Acsp02_89710 [Actinoplanes sp. NBRC 103695]|nr:hypothetical protein Acsp02_89710 [Actinoplanes sp. NBRC 103695]